MSSRTIFLSKLIGIFCIIVSLLMIIHSQSFPELVAGLLHDRSFLLIAGMIGLIAGLAMVLGHNIWSGGALPVVVTLLGWIILIRGLLLLFLTPDTIADIFGKLHFGEFFYIYAAIPLVTGLYLTYGGFKSSLHLHENNKR